MLDDVKKLISRLQNNDPVLLSLSLGSHGIPIDTNAAMPIILALRSNATLKKLEFNHLYLSFNYSTEIAETLRLNQSLQTLIFKHCTFGMRDIHGLFNIFRAIASNSNLKELIFYGSDIYSNFSNNYKAYNFLLSRNYSLIKLEFNTGVTTADEIYKRILERNIQIAHCIDLLKFGVAVDPICLDGARIRLERLSKPELDNKKYPLPNSDYLIEIIRLLQGYSKLLKSRPQTINSLLSTPFSNQSLQQIADQALSHSWLTRTIPEIHANNFTGQIYNFFNTFSRTHRPENNILSTTQNSLATLNE